MFYLENHLTNVFTNGFNHTQRWDEIRAWPDFWSWVIPLHDDVFFVWISSQAAKAQLD